jgi:hypothetical protein
VVEAALSNFNLTRFDKGVITVDNEVVPIDLLNVAGKIADLKIVDNSLVMEYEPLDNPRGMLLRLLNEKLSFYPVSLGTVDLNTKVVLDMEISHINASLNRLSR